LRWTIFIAYINPDIGIINYLVPFALIVKYLLIGKSRTWRIHEFSFEDVCIIDVIKSTGTFLAILYKIHESFLFNIVRFYVIKVSEKF